MGISDINKCIMSGRLTKDSELRYTTGGYAILKFSIAYTRSVKKGDAWEDKSCYINCVMFGKRAESLVGYLLKGKQVFIDGTLDWQSWEKDGVTRSAHSLIVDSLVMAKDGKIGGKKQEPEPEYDPDDVPF